MAYERVIATRYVSTGAEKMVKDQEKVAKATEKQGKAAKKSADSTSQWLQRNETTMTAIAAAGAALMYGIIKSSPVLNASLASSRIAFSLLFMEMGTHLEPIFKAIEKAAWKLYDVFTGLPEPVQKVISIVGFLVAALIAIIIATNAVNASFIVNTVQTGFMTIKTGALAVSTTVATAAQWAWNAAMIANPIGLLVAAIVAAIAAVVFLTIKYDKIKEKLGAWTHAIMFFLGPIGWMVEAIQGVIYIVEHWGNITDWLKSKWDTIASFFSELGSKILNAIKPLGTAEFWVAILNGLLNIGGMMVDKIIEGIGNIGAKIWAAIKNGFTSIKEKAMEWVKGALDWGKHIVQNIAKGIKSGWDKAKDAVKNVGKKIKNVFSFDLRKNDLWAMRSGADMIKYFSQGMQDAQRSLGMKGQGLGPAAFTPSPASTSTTKTNVINIGSINLTGDTGSMGAGSRLGLAAGDSIIEKLRRR